jgi:hypothetical protein
MTRFTLRPLSAQEEIRALAETFADMHEVLDTIVTNAPELLPGESVSDITDAWAASQPSFLVLMQSLGASNLTAEPTQLPASTIDSKALGEKQLLGAVGKVKRNMLARLKDRFFSFWNFMPRTDEQRIGAADAAGDFCEFAGTLAGSCPGADKVEELIMLIKQALKWRWGRRGGHKATAEIS